jgi:hypothetical protein
MLLRPFIAMQNRNTEITLNYFCFVLCFGFDIPFEILTAVLQGRDVWEFTAISGRFILKCKLKK